jgi:glycosyltransferase involved in cell wall biosynthesis
LVVRRKVSSIYDNLGYAYSKPNPLINVRIPGFDLFVRYYDNFNKYYGRKINNLAIVKKISIIHSHGPADDLGFMGEKYTDIPLVHEVFDASSLYDESSYGEWISGGLLRRIGMDARIRRRLREKDLFWEKYIHEKADGLVYTSEYMLNAVKDKYDIKGESCVIPNAILKKDIPKKILPKIREKDGGIHTVYVGALSIDSGHRNIIPILKQITKQDVHVHIYGVMEDPVKEVLNDLVKKDSFFHVHKPLPYSKLLEELTKFDFGLVLLAPANERLLNTAIPNKIFEYLGSELPVIVSPYNSLIDFVTKRHCGFVLRDVNEIHSKISKKYNIGNKDEYTMDYHIPKLVKMYKNLMN